MTNVVQTAAALARGTSQTLMPGAHEGEFPPLVEPRDRCHSHGVSVGQTAFADARIFAGLGAAELEQVRSAFREHTFPAGSAIVREGERGARVLAFFVITSGTVRIESGGSFICSGGPGTHIGEIGLLEDVPRTATVIAESDVVCLGMSAWDFRRLVESHPSVAAKLTEIAAARRVQGDTAGEER